MRHAGPGLTCQAALGLIMGALATAACGQGTAVPSPTATPSPQPSTQTPSPTATSTNTPTPVVTLPVSIGTAHPVPLEPIGAGNIDRLTAYATWGDMGQLSSLALAADGSRVAVGTFDGRVHLLPLPSGDPILTLDAHTTRVWGVALSPDGSLLASGSFDDSVKLWSTHDGALVADLDAPFRDVFAVAFSPDGTRLGTASFDGVLRVGRGACARLEPRHSGGRRPWAAGG